MVSMLTTAFADNAVRSALSATAAFLGISVHSVNIEMDDSVVNGESRRSNRSTTSKIEEAASRPADNKILYSVGECPPWYICIFLGFQVGI